MTPVRTAVVGCGHFGRYHAEKYAGLPEAELVAVVDCELGRARELGARLGVEPLGAVGELAGQVEAASVVVPTRAHFAVARQLLDAGLHVLLEKPIAATLEEADALIALADARGVVLQIGHLERFNAAILALADVLTGALVHRVAQAGAVQAARHRRRRGARSDDP